MKQENIDKIIRHYTYYTTAAGLLPIPVADLVLISGLQIRMVYVLSQEYDIPFKKNRVISVIGALFGYIIPNSFTRTFVSSLLKIIPGIGTILGVVSMPIFTGAATWTLGQIFARHFDKGGNIMNFSVEDYKNDLKDAFKEGLNIAKEAKLDIDKNGVSSEQIRKEADLIEE